MRAAGRARQCGRKREKARFLDLVGCDRGVYLYFFFRPLTKMLFILRKTLLSPSRRSSPLAWRASPPAALGRTVEGAHSVLMR